MFGIYLIPVEDRVEVYKANIKFGKVTTMYKGDTTLPVSDAVNRLMYQLTQMIAKIACYFAWPYEFL